mmetsp:Transcript_26546/g.56523  ORF Transcript_26546/g.56523 Transcript_26546/m.56523 type:complete len:211 (+) Transcript_26546:377-1009(+)
MPSCPQPCERARTTKGHSDFSQKLLATLPRPRLPAPRHTAVPGPHSASSSRHTEEVIATLTSNLKLFSRWTTACSCADLIIIDSTMSLSVSCRCKSVTCPCGSNDGVEHNFLPCWVGTCKIKMRSPRQARVNASIKACWELAKSFVPIPTTQVMLVCGLFSLISATAGVLLNSTNEDTNGSFIDAPGTHGIASSSSVSVCSQSVSHCSSD